MDKQTRPIRLSLILLLVFFTHQAWAQSFTILTWNIQDLGRTKDDQEIAAISKIINKYDIIAIQEVVAKDPAGAKAIARIADNLNRMGNRWDYRISDPTQSPTPQHSERYAFIWKSSKIQLVARPVLDRTLKDICFREPYIGKFKLKGGNAPFYIVNYHSRKHNDNPEQEITYLDKYQRDYSTELVFIAGDFNLDENHPVWKKFYQVGYSPSIKNSPTTLKRKCAGATYLNHSIDNIYYDRDVVRVIRAGKEDFVKNCTYLVTARSISDHLPVFIECKIYGD